MMHKIIITTTFAFFLFGLNLMAQSPNKFNYQAVARNTDSELMANQTIQVRFSIVDNSPDGMFLYTETHTGVTTNQFGLFNLAIGELATNDDFDNIDWGMGSKYLKIEIDPNNNGGFFDLGASQLLSVPYAMHAKTAGSGGGTGSQGDPGNGIQNTTFNNGMITLEFDDGTTFTTSDLTGPQGTAGADGQNGEDGVDGTGVLIVGSVSIAVNLPAIYNGSIGDMFITQNDGHGHVWDGSQFVDVGQIQGPEGDQGLQGIAGVNGTNGMNGTNGTNGEDGADGNGIASATNNGNGTFTLTFNDGATFTTSDLTGSQGTQGAQGSAGQNGQDGTDGADGADGQDGAGVTIVGSVATAASLDPAYGGNIGDMIIAQNDGHGHVWDGNNWNDVGQIQGPQGNPGSTGTNGSNGTNGLNGTNGMNGNGIASVSDNGNGTYTFNFTDGTTYTTADLTGSQGAMGNPGIQGPQGNSGIAGTNGSNGMAGADGTNGTNGNGITSVNNNGDGTYTFNFTNGSTYTTADLTGPTGTYTAGSGLEISGNTINSLWAENVNNVVLAPGSQNVGIGVLVPEVQLHVLDDIRVEGFNPAMEFYYEGEEEMRIFSSGSGHINALNALNIRANTDGGLSHMSFFNNNQIGLEITDNHNVGIRTSSPTAAFHVVHKLTGGGGDSREDGFKLQNEGSNNSYWTMYVQNGSGDLSLYSPNSVNYIGAFDNMSGTYTAILDLNLFQYVTDKMLLLALKKTHFS